MGKLFSHHWEKLLLLFFVFFSAYLMLHTFSYDRESNEIVMASHAWSDFGAHIPLIRSFSLGSNWPPEYPIFPGEKIRYHFLFYAIVGLLERVGFRIDWAVNIPSIAGFFLLLVGIYSLTKLLFTKKRVALLAVIFFLFNGSFSFIKFFEKTPLNVSTLRDILTHNQFATFGPWDGNLVTAFVHLNVYTNQRHLALSLAIVLFIIYTLLKMSFSRWSSGESIPEEINILNNTPSPDTVSKIFSRDNRNGLVIGLFTGSLFFLNHPALLITVIFCVYLFLFHKHTRIPLLIAGVTALPFLWYFFQIAQPGGNPTWEVGFLSKKPFALQTFGEFWLHNLGLHIFFIPLGILLAPKKIRFLFLPLVVLFILPNLYRFSVDMINNHKFFNFVTIIGGMYSAHALITIHSFLKKKIKLLPSILLATFCLLLTFSGFLDFIVIANDRVITLRDIPNNQDALFFQTNTPPNTVVLNSTWFYHPASLAGRKIYNGYSFFTWSAGYDTYKREAITKEMYQFYDREQLCRLLSLTNISYVEVNNTPDQYLLPISPLWNDLPSIYSNPETGVTIYNTIEICQNYDGYIEFISTP